MTTLSDRLTAMRESATIRLKPEISELIERHLTELRDRRGGIRPLRVGDTAPPFVLKDMDGKAVSSSDLLTHGPVVVSFFRGTWCPFCNAELKALNESRESFRRHGASLVAVTPQSAASADAYRREHAIAFPMLVDTNADVAETFGLAYSFPAYLSDLYRKVFGNDLARVNASGTWRLPIPARYVIDTDGAIVSAEANPDYRFRPDPEATLTEVAALASSACAC
jgi:peroxiredoxin